MAGIIAVADDLFFVAKMQQTAKQVGAELRLVRAADFHLESFKADKPALVIFDLNAPSADVVELIRQMKGDDDWKAVPVVAFLSHVQVDLQRAAQQAGADQVLPRSKFSANLAEILRHPAGPVPP
ncbi:response regulator [Acidobacteriia bacterium AH_259_A11_L15]|nr:response regulator [Acidobacteriia bacterium AH_259_A11_L15]